MGPDHPQWEMWKTTQHGQIYQVRGAADGPDCQECHLADGGHNVSKGITVTPGGKSLPPEQVLTERSKMLDVCSGCHGRSFAERELLRGDRIREQSKAIVSRARKIIEDLADRGLLEPGPADRPAHPLRGKTLVLDGQMLYEDISHIERLFFKMQKYDFAKTWKGAYHQNPDYTHWYGNAELKMDLVDIQAEAKRLLAAENAKKSQAVAPAGAGSEAGLTEELQRLKNRFSRGGMSEKDYQLEKKRLLEQWQ